MQPGQEVAFLRPRTGFVKLALQYGACLVPVFAFNQSAQYSYWRPFIDAPRSGLGSTLITRLARLAGFLPLIPIGRLGLPLPRKAPLTMVIGAPLVLPKIEQPSGEQIQHYLGLFIQKMEEMYAAHAEDAGCGNVPFQVC